MVKEPNHLSIPVDECNGSLGRLLALPLASVIFSLFLWCITMPAAQAAPVVAPPIHPSTISAYQVTTVTLFVDSYYAQCPATFFTYKCPRLREGNGAWFPGNYAYQFSNFAYAPSYFYELQATKEYIGNPSCQDDCPQWRYTVLSEQKTSEISPQADNDFDLLKDSLEDRNGNSDPYDDDSDGDGVPDFLDGDDDGDGIPTKYEGIRADNGGGTITYFAIDSDYDTVPNYLDLDSDNDGVPDGVEAYDVNNDGEIDIMPSGVDANGDGVDDAYLPLNGPVITPIFPDQDGDSIPNFLDNDNVVRAVPIKLILSGAYNANSQIMRDQLRSLPDFPSKSPYGGGEQIAATAILTTNNIVDWVLIEIRGPLSTTLVASQAALLQVDGDVVAVDGVSPVRFSGLPNSSYYVTVRHRNHLGVMTAAPIELSPSTPVLDLTNPATAVYGTHARRIIGNVSTLWSGDANANNRIIGAGVGNDINPILMEVLGAPGNVAQVENYIVRAYSARDVNLDGRVILSGPGNDINLIIFNGLAHPSNSTFAANFIIQGQLPTP